MLLPVLLLLLFSPLCASQATSEKAADGPKLCSSVQKAVHQAHLLTLKCDALLYRSLVRDDSCYFAIHIKTQFTDGSGLCRKAMPTAEMRSGRDRDGILEAMKLNKEDYHSDQTFYGEKAVLCRYQNPFSCSPADGQTSLMNGRCFTKYNQKLTFREAYKFCPERAIAGSRLPWIRNSDDNAALEKFLRETGSSAAWVDQAVINDRWRAVVNEPVSYFNWDFEDRGPKFNCRDDIAATVSPIKTRGCTSASTWAIANWNAMRQVICVRHACSPFYPSNATTTGPSLPEEPTTTKPTTTTEETTTRKKTTTTRRDSSEETTTKRTRKTTKKTTTTEEPTTTTVATTTKKVIVYPANNWPMPGWFWTLRYYYNFVRILHAFCAPEHGPGCAAMWNNGIGYSGSDGSGNLGRTISDWGMTQMNTVCSANYNKLKKLWFKRNGNSYRHDFGWGEIYVGWVAQVQGHCGAHLPIRAWGCIFPQDVMYGGDLSGNTWYRGRVWNNWVPYFWLW